VGRRCWLCCQVEEIKKVEHVLQWVTPELLQLVGLVIALLFSYLKVQEKIKGKKYEQALLILKDATMETYHTFVQELKAKRAVKGGKLTIKEKREAMDRTVEMAMGMAKAKGIDLIKALGSAYLPGLVEGVISHEKKKAVEAKKAA